MHITKNNENSKYNSQNLNQKQCLLVKKKKFVYDQYTSFSDSEKMTIKSRNNSAFFPRIISTNNNHMNIFSSNNNNMNNNYSDNADYYKLKDNLNNTNKLHNLKMNKEEIINKTEISNKNFKNSRVPSIKTKIIIFKKNNTPENEIDLNYHYNYLNCLNTADQEMNSTLFFRHVNNEIDQNNLFCVPFNKTILPNQILNNYNFSIIKDNTYITSNTENQKINEKRKSYLVKVKEIDKQIKIEEEKLFKLKKEKRDILNNNNKTINLSDNCSYFKNFHEKNKSFNKKTNEKISNKKSSINYIKKKYVKKSKINNNNIISLNLFDNNFSSTKSDFSTHQNKSVCNELKGMKMKNKFLKFSSNLSERVKIIKINQNRTMNLNKKITISNSSKNLVKRRIKKKSGCITVKFDLEEKKKVGNLTINNSRILNDKKNVTEKNKNKNINDIKRTKSLNFEKSITLAFSNKKSNIINKNKIYKNGLLFKELLNKKKINTNDKKKRKNNNKKVKSSKDNNKVIIKKASINLDI